MMTCLEKKEQLNVIAKMAIAFRGVAIRPFRINSNLSSASSIARISSSN